MKRILYLIVVLLHLFKAEAQISQTEQDHLKKYWNYRDRYKKHFVKIGGQPGESTPISEWYKTQNCGDIQGGQIKMGDAMAFLGDYMCLLATEYYLTKKQGGNLTAIQNEIYFALKAIGRVDKFAEIYLNHMEGDGQTNGFILRDDVPLDFYKNWQETDNVQFLDGNRSNGFLWDTTFVITSPVMYSTPPMPGDSIWLAGTGRYYFKFDDNTANFKPEGLQNLLAYKWYFGSPDGTQGCGKIKNDTIFNDEQTVHNEEMSQDHLIGLVTGLTAIVKLVDDDMVIPSADDDTLWLVSAAKILGRRLMDYISSTKTIVDPDIADIEINYPFYGTVDLVPWVPADVEINWFLTNPLTNQPVKAGCNSWLFSYPLSEIGNGFDPGTAYDPHLKLELSAWPHTDILWILETSGGTLSSAALQNLLHHPDNLWADFIIEQKAIRDEDDVTNQMICWLAAASNSLAKSEYAEMAADFNMPWFELLDIVLNRFDSETQSFESTLNKTRIQYRNILDSALCEGNKKESGENIHSPFNRPSIFSLPNAVYSTRVIGDYNGIDYMLLYNMYRMVFPDSLPDYIPNTCPCNNGTTKVLETVGTGIGSTGHSLKTSVETFFRFPDYKKFDIPIPEYANHDIDIGDTNSSASTAVLKINGDLTICNSTMQVLNKGKLHITPSVPDYEREIRVANGSELRIAINGIVEIGNLSSLIIEKGGKLTIGQNSHIILNGSASRLIVEGEIVLEENTEMKIEWPEDSIPGTVVFKSTNIPIKVSATGNNAVFNLSSLDNEHTYIEIIGQAGLEVENTVDSMIVKNAGILLDEKSRIKVHCPLTVEHVEASPKYPDQDKPYHSAFFVYGQRNVKISFSHFTGGIMALGGKLFSYGVNNPVLNYVDIDHCLYGVQLGNAGITAKNSTFSDNGIGIDLQGSTTESFVENCNFNDNYPMGILINSTSLGELNLRNSTIDGGHQCITSGGATIRPFCNQLKNTDEGIFLNDMAFLNLNALNSSGYNKIESNYYGIYGDQYDNDNTMGAYSARTTAGYLDLNNGYTVFGNINQHIKLFVGNKQAFSMIPYPPNPVFINSSKNYWYLRNAPNLDDSIDYLMKYKPAYHIPGIPDFTIPSSRVRINQVDDYSLYSNLNSDLSNVCAWPPPAEREWPRDTMPKDCDDKVINSAHISNKLLSEAYATSTQNLYQIGDKPEALVSYREILLAPIPASTRCLSDQYFLTKSYQNSFVAFGQMFSDTLASDALRDGLCNDMIDLVDTLLTLGTNGDSLWESYRYTLNLDKSDLYRLMGNYDDAIDLLNEMAEEYEDNPWQLQKINYQLCLNESEQAFLYSGMSENDVDSIYNCHRSFEPEEEYQGAGSIVQKDPAKIKEVNKPIISLMPNPANDAITLSSNQPIKGAVVYDNIGKEVIRVSNQNTQTLKIDIAKLPNGIYRVLIDMGRSKSIKTFMVN